MAFTCCSQGYDSLERSSRYYGRKCCYLVGGPNGFLCCSVSDTTCGDHQVDQFRFLQESYLLSPCCCMYYLIVSLIVPMPGDDMFMLPKPETATILSCFLNMMYISLYVYWVFLFIGLYISLSILCL